MKPFKFKLQKILEYREQLEEQARLALAKAQQAVREQKELLNRLQGDLARAEAEFGERTDLTSGDLWLWRTYHERMEQDIAEAEHTLARKEHMLEAARREAVQRSMDRKILDKLKTKQAERHVEEQNLKEQKEADEISALRHQIQHV
jgi:flagellar FliJ protein